VCDLCDGPFVACSAACLARHQADAHGADGGRPAAARAAAYQARVNRNFAGNRAWYAEHREQLMALLAGGAPGGRAICVLGAGNGSDLDLPALAASFSSIHLVDLDGEALARCAAEAPATLRERLVLHPELDLTGFAEHLDAWGDQFPSEAELGHLALTAIQGILRRLGRRFDVVVSTCALSQLAVPYHRAWILSATNWGHLHAAVTAVHLATLAGATEPGGTGILVFDVLSSKNVPELRALEGRGPEALASFLASFFATLGDGPGPDRPRLDPEPTGLLARLQAPGLARLVESARLTAPWLWNIGAETQLVYGLVFRRPGGLP
jgi:hypothetical protein